MGFQEPYSFQSGCSKCNAMDLNEYYGSQKGGVPKKQAKKSASTKKKPAKKSSSTKKRGGSDAFDEFDKINSSLTWATQTGGTKLASEYYTSAQQGSYAPYNASKDAKCGGGRKKRVIRGGGGMDDYEGKMNQSQGNMNGHMGRLMADANKPIMGGGRKKRVVRGGGEMDDYEAKMNQSQGNMTGSMAAADSATKGGGCGCGYKPKTSGARRGGSDGYYAGTLTGSDPVVETEDVLEDGKLNGGAKKKRSSSKGAKKPAKAKTRSSSSKGAKKTTKPKSSRKLKGGDDSAGGGSDFKSTFMSWGPINTTSETDKAYFPIFNKSTPFMSKKELVECGVAPVSTGCSPDPNPYPRAYNDDFIGGSKKRKPAKKSTSSKTKAKPAKKSTSSKTKAKPAKKSTSSKSKAKKH